jgi:hypothetical protein
MVEPALPPAPEVPPKALTPPAPALPPEPDPPTLRIRDALSPHATVHMQQATTPAAAASLRGQLAPTVCTPEA